MFFDPKKSHPNDKILQEKLSELEAKSGGRIGLSAVSTEGNQSLTYRAEEYFPMGSTAKVMVVGAILKKSMEENAFLEKRISYTEEAVSSSVGYCPITREKQKDGMTISELCHAIILSDNAAMNLLMTELGGPQSITEFARSLGDNEFQLDRWEPELNSAIPGDRRDTSTPQAIQQSLKKLLLENFLSPHLSEQLAQWLISNNTGNKRIRAGVPEGWIVGDKTGTSKYGTTSDIGIIYPPNGSPIILSIYFTQPEENALPREDIIAEVTNMVVCEFGYTNEYRIGYTNEYRK